MDKDEIKKLIMNFGKECFKSGYIIGKSGFSGTLQEQAVKTKDSFNTLLNKLEIESQEEILSLIAG